MDFALKVIPWSETQTVRLQVQYMRVWLGFIHLHNGVKQCSLQVRIDDYHRFNLGDRVGPGIGSEG